MAIAHPCFLVGQEEKIDTWYGPREHAGFNVKLCELMIDCIVCLARDVTHNATKSFSTHLHVEGLGWYCPLVPQIMRPRRLPYRDACHQRVIKN